MTKPRRILFVTGTRADFGKLKPLINAVEKSDKFVCSVFVTGMHTLSIYGSTQNEVFACEYSNIHVYLNQIINDPMEQILANTIDGLSRFLHENPHDMIVVHGDRIEAMAGAIVGMLRNILVAHIEGGELSGTVDGMIRHAVSKLAHIHFVANQEAEQRIIQLGEDPSAIMVIGSPDVDVMMSPNLPSINDVKKHYEIRFNDYAIAMYHPVTTEINTLSEKSKIFVDALVQSERNYVVILPNNDEGTLIILNELERLKENPKFRIFPSIRFESFLSLLRNAKFIIGNSSAGIREAPYFGVPTVNVGTRQEGRLIHSSIIDTKTDVREMLAAIKTAENLKPETEKNIFGKGNSVKHFMDAIEAEKTWKIPTQKQFKELS